MTAAADSKAPGMDLAANYALKVTGARKLERADQRFFWLTLASALAVLLIFVGVFIALMKGAWPALSEFGLEFFYTQKWNPVTEKFGILALIIGTLVTSALAMLFAVPVGIGIAIFLTEICPRKLRRPIGIAVELLAGIPSIIYGIWGLFVFAPWFQVNVQPILIDILSPIPFVGFLFAGPPYGIGVFTGSLILAIMILPLISSITRDVFDTVPPMLKEAGYGIGCTNWEVIWNIVLPYARTGVVGGAMLALGRALGETMAITFVIGNAHKIPTSLFAPGTTISAAIANEFAEATSEIHQSTLIAAGLFLFIVTFFVLAGAQWMLANLDKAAGGNKK